MSLTQVAVVAKKLALTDMSLVSWDSAKRARMETEMRRCARDTYWY